MKTKAILSLSGGLDSAVLLAHTAQSRDVSCVGFSYGSKHNPYENAAAVSIAAHYGVPFRLVDLSSVFLAMLKSDLLRNGGDVPEGHYEADSMRRTVVPGRNLIFASLLAGLAMSDRANEVWMGVHAGDHFIYPDCRPDFFHHLNRAVLEASEGSVWIRTPLMNIDKAEIVKRGIVLGVPFHLTRTCYVNDPIACGRCGSCQERLEAFYLNGIEDPIKYNSRVLFPKGESSGKVEGGAGV